MAKVKTSITIDPRLLKIFKRLDFPLSEFLEICMKGTIENTETIKARIEATKKDLARCIQELNTLDVNANDALYSLSGKTTNTSIRLDNTILAFCKQNQITPVKLLQRSFNTENKIATLYLEEIKKHLETLYDSELELTFKERFLPKNSTD